MTPPSSPERAKSKSKKIQQPTTAVCFRLSALGTIAEVKVREYAPQIREEGGSASPCENACVLPTHLPRKTTALDFHDCDWYKHLEAGKIYLSRLTVLEGFVHQAREATVEQPTSWLPGSRG